jgi:hypothetical protein
MSELAVGSLKGLAANSFVIDVASGSKLVQPGMIVAVKSVLFTGTQVASSVAAGGNVAVTDLSITHEVSNAANKLIISAFVGVGATSGGDGRFSIALHDGSSFIGVGDVAGSRPQVTSGGRLTSAGATNVNNSPSFTLVHAPGAGSKTYNIRAVNSRSSISTLYINRTQDDTDNADFQRGASALVIQEVAV